MGREETWHSCDNVLFYRVRPVQPSIIIMHPPHPPNITPHRLEPGGPGIHFKMPIEADDVDRSAEVKDNQSALADNTGVGDADVEAGTATEATEDSDGSSSESDSDSAAATVPGSPEPSPKGTVGPKVGSESHLASSTAAPEKTLVSLPPTSAEQVQVCGAPCQL